jgi:hypothetical protein
MTYSGLKPFETTLERGDTNNLPTATRLHITCLEINSERFSNLDLEPSEDSDLPHSTGSRSFGQAVHQTFEQAVEQVVDGANGVEGSSRTIAPGAIPPFQAASFDPSLSHTLIASTLMKLLYHKGSANDLKCQPTRQETVETQTQAAVEQAIAQQLGGRLSFGELSVESLTSEPLTSEPLIEALNQGRSPVVAAVDGLASQMDGSAIAALDWQLSTIEGVDTELCRPPQSGVVTLLHDVEQSLSKWSRELEWVRDQIRTLHEEGPVVEGWLESRAVAPAVAPLCDELSQQWWQPEADENRATAASDDTTTATAAAPDAVVAMLASLEAMFNRSINQSANVQPSRTDSSRTDYRLCGFNQGGRFWSRPCPAEQLPTVSLAIARYHRLRDLRNIQQELEYRLSPLLQSLTDLRGFVQV